MKKPIHVSSLLGNRVNVDYICQDCELEISGVLLTVDLRVMDMSEFDVILGMDWLTVFPMRFFATQIFLGKFWCVTL